MLFALKGVWIKLIYRYGIDTTSLLAMRMVVAVPVFALVGVQRWHRLERHARPDARTVGLAMLVGIIGYYVSSWLDFQGLQTLDAQIKRLILFTYPFLVILFGRLLLRHPLRAHALLGAGLSYVGLFVMFAGEPSRLGTAALIGGAFVAVAAVTFALYQLFARELILRCGAPLFTAIAMSAAGVMALLGFFLTHAPAALMPPRGRVDAYHGAGGLLDDRARLPDVCGHGEDRCAGHRHRLDDQPGGDDCRGGDGAGRTVRLARSGRNRLRAWRRRPVQRDREPSAIVPGGRGRPGLSAWV